MQHVGFRFRPVALLTWTSFAVILCTSPAMPQKKLQGSISTTSQLKDMRAGAPASEDVNSMIEQGVILPRYPRQFAPDEAMTLGEFAVSAQKLFALRPPAERAVFTDVGTGSPYYSAIQAIAPYLKRQLLCPGCALGTKLLPNQPLSRAQAMVILVSILHSENKLALLSPQQSEEALRGVADAGEIPAPVRPYVATAIKSELLPLTSKKLIDPGLEVSRAEIAVFLHGTQTKMKLPFVRP
jgi:S-layer homology domain